MGPALEYLRDCSSHTSLSGGEGDYFGLCRWVGPGGEDRGVRDRVSDGEKIRIERRSTIPVSIALGARRLGCTAVPFTTEG